MQKKSKRHVRVSVVVVIASLVSVMFIYDIVSRRDALLHRLNICGSFTNLWWFCGSEEYKQMRRVTRSNYAHFVRDLIWRSIVRDWPDRPVRLERWMMEREPEFFNQLESVGALKFEVVSEGSKLFEWSTCLEVCGSFFQEKCSSSVNVVNLLGDSFRGETVTKRRDTKRMVWLSRGKDNTRRAIVNEPDVYRALVTSDCCSGTKNIRNSNDYIFIAGLEFLRIEPTKLGGNPISKQAEMFADVDVLVSLHGAGLTNMLFMPRGSLIVEIMPGAYDKPTYRGLAGLLGHRYRRIHTTTSKPSVITRLMNAFNSRSDRQRKFRRDALVRMQPKETAEIEAVLIEEVIESNRKRGFGV